MNTNFKIGSLIQFYFPQTGRVHKDTLGLVTNIIECPNRGSLLRDKCYECEGGYYKVMWLKAECSLEHLSANMCPDRIIKYNE